MCGLFASFSRAGPVTEDYTRELTMLAHRGPDGWGTERISLNSGSETTGRIPNSVRNSGVKRSTAFFSTRQPTATTTEKFFGFRLNSVRTFARIVSLSRIAERAARYLGLQPEPEPLTAEAMTQNNRLRTR